MKSCLTEDVAWKQGYVECLVTVSPLVPNTLKWQKTIPTAKGQDPCDSLFMAGPDTKCKPIARLHNNQAPSEAMSLNLVGVGVGGHADAILTYNGLLFVPFKASNECDGYHARIRLQRQYAISVGQLSIGIPTK
jgi:hypothetical protein